MEKVKKYFGEFDMNWGRVFSFAIIAAVVTAGLNLIPALNDTSFQDIAVNLDCWILFAIFIIVNCDKWWEASLKCFVFFLISQPLIYLIAVPFQSLGWDVFGYYQYWFKMTVLTLPGAAIAFLVKRKDWLSVAVLSVATGFLAYMCVYYFDSIIANFPHHLLSSVFCLALAIFLVLVLFDEKKHRTVALAIIGVVLAVSIGIYVVHNSGGHVTTLDLADGEWTCTVQDEDIAEVEINEDNLATVTSKTSGYTIITFENSEGELLEYSFLADGRNLMLNPID